MIRTYARKPQECRYIEGVLGLCRLCLQRAEETMPIFTEDRTEICSSLALRIMICVGLELKREETLPSHICMACYKDLEQYYAFRKKCEVSYQKLKLHIQAIQNRQAAEALSSSTEEAIKQIDAECQDQEENVNVDELELMMGSEESYGVLEIEAPPEMSDVPINIPSASNETKIEETVTTDPAELPSMITAVLVKLGLLSRTGSFLDCQSPHPTHVQLETADDAVVTMEVVEEYDESTTGSVVVIQAGPNHDVQETKADICVTPVKQEGVQKMSTDGQVKKIPGDVEPKKGAVRRRRTWGSVECSWCARVLPSASALRRHARTHSGERPFACRVCQRRFAQKEVMLRHMLIHDEVRPHQCSKCPKSFTQRNALALHERSHLPPHERALPLHSCPHCPKLFLYSSGLSRHMMTHAGRLYECGACHRQFADKSSVLRHVRKANHPPPASPVAPAPPQ